MGSFARGQNAGGWQSIADLRPGSPGQLALIGVGLWLAGALLPLLHALATVGVVLLVVAGLSLFIRPRARTMYWRGRRIDLDDEPSAGERLYRLIYRTR
ncbi:MAG TPA: hypothetical protein VII06_19015 [Chloroflexota bacterium]|jgi:hypothetical protein